MPGSRNMVLPRFVSFPVFVASFESGTVGGICRNNEGPAPVYVELREVMHNGGP